MKRICLMVALFAIITFMGFAQNSNPQSIFQKLPNDPNVRVGKLENGLTYYIQQNKKPKGRAEFYLATNVGAIQEDPDQDGLAHFLEHMCFNGTKNFPDKGIIDYLQSIGASFGGNVNAYTGVENTVYMLTNIPLIRPSVIDSCLLILHDYAHYVTNDPKEIDKERPVILAERRQRRNASWRMHEKSLPYLYGDTKYGKCTLIGLRESLINFKHESLVNFYKTWYHPDMQAVIVVGDINVDEVEKRIKQTFSAIPKAENPRKKEIINIPDNKEPVIGILTDPEATGSSISIMWKHHPLPDSLNNTYLGRCMDLVKYIASSVASERFNEICSKPDAPFLGAGFGIGNLCKTCEVASGNVSFKEGEAISAFKAMYTEIERFKKYGYSEDEINRAKDNILSDYESAAKRADSRKNDEFVQPLINNFFNNDSYMSPEDGYKVTKSLLKIIGPKEVNELLKKVITDTNLVIIYNGPQKQSKKEQNRITPTKNQILDAIKYVRNQKIEAPVLNTINKELLDTNKVIGSKVIKESKGIYNSTVWTLGNGLKVILYPTEFDKDNIRFNLYKQGGTSLFDDQQMNNMNGNIFSIYLSNTGLSKFPATELPKMLSGKNAAVQPYIDLLSSGIAGTTTPKDFETALQLMYLYYTDPRFDKEEFNIGLQSYKANIKNIMDQPNYKYMEEFIKTAYNNNPRIKLLTPELLNNANISEIEKNYKQIFNDINGATLVIVGYFQPNNIKRLVEKYFGALPKGEKPTNWVDRNLDYVRGSVKKDFAVQMQTPQTTVQEIFSMPMKFSQKRNFALRAAQYIMDMRYVKSLREEEGGTYGANTNGSLSRRPKQEATFIIQYQCQPSKADKLRELAMKGLKEMAESGPTEEEFKMSIENMLKYLPEQRISNKYWMNNIVGYELYNTDNDKETEKTIKELKADDVKNIIKELLESGNHIEIIMRPKNSAEKE